MFDTGGSESNLSALKQELLELEIALLQPAVRHNREALAALLDDDFREFGSSGRIYTKQAVIDALQKESELHFSIRDFRVAAVQDGVMLATYTASSAAGASLRSSLWVMREARWQMLFHQGTRLTYSVSSRS